LLATPQNQLTRWQEYFKNNLAAPLQQMSITTTQRTPDTTKIPSGVPTGNEIITAIKNLKSNKASGLDNLPPEIFKTYPHTIANILEPFLKRSMGFWPNHKRMETRAHHKLPKKGDLSAAIGGE
jgi:hypothetical protein